MQQNLATLWRRLGVWAAVGLVSVTSWLLAAPALAINNPDLLPNAPTAVVDLAKTFTTNQLALIDQELGQFETETGWKLRVLTQFDRTPGSAVKDFWHLDQNSILVVADSRGGNILNFNVGDAVYKYMPRTFWIELQTRFGNQFFVRDHGEDQAILQSLQSVQTCLRQGGCSVVPGLPQEQWILTLATSLAGGLILGFASRPRKPGQFLAWQWALLFSPLWGMLFFSFGLGPVLVRTTEWLPIVRNISGFMIAALVAYLIPLFSDMAPSESEI
jgi:TPM domain